MNPIAKVVTHLTSTKVAPAGKAWFASLIVALLLGSGAVTALVWPSDQLAPDTVAIVDGSKITVSDLDSRLQLLGALYGLHRPTDKDALDTFYKASGKSMVVAHILEGAATEAGIVIADPATQAELSKFIDTTFGGDRDAFVAFLADNRITEHDVSGELQRTLATRALFEKVTAAVPQATEVEARAFYEANRDAMRSAEARNLRNIVTKTQGDAEQVLRRLRTGAPFAKVAKEESLDNSTRSKGGTLGAVRQAELDPAYAAVAFKAPVGKPFGPVQTEFGWNVGLVESVVPGQPLSFDKIKDALISNLTSQAQQVAWNQWLSGKLKEAEAVYAAKYRPADPDSAPSVLPTAAPSAP